MAETTAPLPGTPAPRPATRAREAGHMAETPAQLHGPPAASRGTRAGAFVRRHRLAPYLLLVPALGGLALVYLWPLVQMLLYSFQNYGLPQVTGAAPVQWVG